MEARVLKVVPLENYRLRVVFETGETRIFDVAPYIRGDWFGKLRDPAYFRTVHPAGETVEWQGGQDLDPHELYELSEPEAEAGKVG